MVPVSHHIAALFGGMGGKYQAGAFHPLVFQVIEGRQSMSFVEVIHIGAPKGLYHFRPSDAQHDVLGNPGLLVGIVQLVCDRPGKKVVLRKVGG